MDDVPTNENPYAAPRTPIEGPKPVVGDLDLRLIAEKQRALITAVGVSLLGSSIPVVLGDSTVGAFAGLLILIGFSVWRGVAAYRLARVMKRSSLWGLLGGLPGIVGILLVIGLNQRATATLKAGGWRVKFLGATPPP